MRRGALMAALALVLLAAAADARAVDVVEMIARRFEYAPETVTAHIGVPLVLEITSLDHDHGFDLPAFGVRADLKKGTTTRIEIVPDKAGTFAFHCDVFCGDGHEDMTGTLQVTE